MFERGFKTWCERLAGQYRRELELAPTDPLDPWALANFLDVRVWIPCEVPDLDPDVLRRLTKEDASFWSAVTICLNGSDLIILNSAHAKSRQSNDLTHELAHLICGHTPARMDVTEDEMLVLNTYDKKQEEEADWLAAALLLPRVALVSIIDRGSDLDHTARIYGVSRRLLDMRINRTGVRLQQQRTDARRRI